METGPALRGPCRGLWRGGGRASINPFVRIHCLTHPWNDRQLRAIAAGISSQASVSESMYFRGSDPSGLMTRYYAALAGPRHCGQSSEANEDTILRCRLLRSLTPDEAGRHLSAMRYAVQGVLDRVLPDLVLSLTVDSFVLDLFRDECAQRAIPFIGLVASFVNGYVRITERGEYRRLRQPDDSEVCEVRRRLCNPTYEPHFLRRAARRPRLTVLRNWSRMLPRPLYFGALRRLSQDPYNTHYWTSQVVSQQLVHLAPRLRLGEPDWENRARARGLPLIMVPLQQVPEATVDYWCRSQRQVRYEECLVEAISRLGSAFHFVVKEHPNVWGFRHPKLYHALASTGAVTFCPPSTPATSVIAKVNAVLVCTGSVGFEAALRGVAVLTLGRPYYCSGQRFLHIDEEASITQVAGHIANSKAPITLDEQAGIVRHLLAGLVPGRFRWADNWDVDRPQHAAEASELGKTLADLYCATG